MLLEFLRSEDGAVTTDWVFMATAAMTTSIAAMTNTSGGVNTIANELADDIAEVEALTLTRSIVQQDVFENGAGNWIGGALASDENYGGLLRGGGSDGEQAAQSTYELDADMEYAVLEFDMTAIDSWDGEEFQIYVNDAVVATATFNNASGNGIGDTWTISNPDIEISMTAGEFGHGGFDSDWQDQSMNVQIQMRNAGENVTLGFGSTLNQSVQDESWGVDNVRVTSTNSV